MTDDRELVSRTLRGDRKAFEMIIRKHQKPLFNYIGRLVGEQEMALDFTQEVFLRAYASLATFRPEFKFTTWLYRIASNFIIDHWRKKKLAVLSLDQPLNPGEDDLCLEAADPDPSVDERLETAELRARIERSLKNLPPELRELFVLRHVSGFSYEEIAEIKKQPVGTVKSKVFKAKEMLRRLLGEISGSEGMS
jgi:RNA polymerase sigma-70 factor (ECF subfamily)